MSQKYKITLLVLLLLGLLIYLAPRLLDVKEVQGELVRQASSALNADVSIGTMRWRWAPLPHLTLFDTTVTHRDFVLQLPKTRIYPDWQTLFAGRVAIGRLYLRSPHVTVNSSFFSETATGEGHGLVLPMVNVTVDDGTLDIEAFANDRFRSKKLSFSDISLKIRKNSDQLAISLQSRSSFARKLSVQGNYFTDSASYAGTVKAAKFDLAQLGELNSNVMKPLASQVDFSSDIIGQGRQSLQILFSGDIPAFSLQRLEQPVPFHFKGAKLLLEKNGVDLSAKIYELSLADPQVSFSGIVSRSVTADSPEPLYRLDLAAKDIDLSGVRARLLTLLGDEHITKTVCNVVRGGRAKSATYTFDAPLAGFSHLQSMIINVDVDNADIHVPGVELDLDRSSGPIIIKDGNIHGYNLTARLGPHFGSNGSFSLGLSENNHLFKLDLDIDADLATLPQALHHLIHNENFRSEVMKFSSQGRKMGHLTVGEDLRDFTVDVSIPDMQGAQVNYERLSWPINLKGGMLHIHGDEVAWQRVSAAIGPHNLMECSGHLSWGDSEIPFEVKSVAATLDATSLFAELNRYPVIAATLLPSVSSIAGVISVNQGTAGGPFLHPSLWQYQLTAGLAQITFTTPHLPETINIDSGTLEMAEEHVTLTDGNTRFLDSPLKLSAELSHHLFSSWKGWLELDGPVTTEQGKWLAGKKWIPDLFFPKIPCTIKKLRINFADSNVAVFGTVQNSSFTGSPVEAVVDVKVKGGRHEQTGLHFFRDQKDGLVIITGDTRSAAPKISFQGSIDWQTVAAIFTTRMVLNGEMEGFFTLTPPVGERQLSFNGRAEARDLQWLWGDYLRQIAISRLSLFGSDQNLSIKDLDFTFENEQVTGSGELQFSPRDVTTDLSLHARTLSQNTLIHFIDDLSVFLGKISGTDKKNLASSLSGNISGAIKVRADEYLFAETIKEGKTRNYKLTPLRGTIDFSNKESTTLILEDSSFCGLGIDGTLAWQDEQSRKEFTLKNPAGSPPLFEEFLTCAGVKNTLISGPFSVNATLMDENGNLSSGKFLLQGKNGVLGKMDILSKIFKLINFTDLYQGLFSSGFRYKLLEVHGHVVKNLLILDKAVIDGEGMDIMAQGNINLQTLDTDLTFFIVPFKTIDKIINMVPLVGRIIGGKKRHIVTYPVKVTGNLRDPELSVLSPTAIGKAAVDFIFDTLTLPLDLLPMPDEAQPEEQTSGEEMKKEMPEKDVTAK
ncbi:MAG: AsmA-like C-terminal domain-containing protein [Proteobacteria bacterium]|nr:AsmA-like C-terminal domain-containing protein [Pseudomonadota bacterium]